MYTYVLSFGATYAYQCVIPVSHSCMLFQGATHAYLCVIPLSHSCMLLIGATHAYQCVIPGIEIINITHTMYSN